MDKLRRSFRSSFRRKEESTEEPHSGSARQWPADEAAVKTNTCSFEVKYLGNVEVGERFKYAHIRDLVFQVFESRGMQVCEEAVKNLKNSKRRPIKGTLHISGDGLRVSDTDTKGLVLDQTIEKVSFCAPDRNFEKGFSYICRDGTTRRWLCHGFMATKDTGERLSHAVGCAFAICLEKKQKRDKECAVMMQYDSNDNTFTRFGSFRQGSISERLQDPQIFKPTEVVCPPKEPVSNPNAIARPKASDLMYIRQASFRGLGQLSGSSPFKRQHSLRLNELPSTLARQADYVATGPACPTNQRTDLVLPVAAVRDIRADQANRRSQILSCPGGIVSNHFSPIKEDPDPDSGQDLDLVSSDPFSPVNPGPHSLPFSHSPLSGSASSLTSNCQGQGILNTHSNLMLGTNGPMSLPSYLPNLNPSPLPTCSRSPLPTVMENDTQRGTEHSQTNSPLTEPNPWDHVPDQPLTRNFHQHQPSQRPTSLKSYLISPDQPQPLDDWLNSQDLSSLQILQPEKSKPNLTSTKSQSLDYSVNYGLPPASLPPTTLEPRPTSSSSNSSQAKMTAILDDPFDAEWANLAMRNNNKNSNKSTNPFSQDTVKTFELQM